MNLVIINLFIISVSFYFVEKYRYVFFYSTKKRMDKIDQHWTCMPYCYTFHRDTFSVLTTLSVIKYNRVHVCWITKQNLDKFARYTKKWFN